MSTAKCKRCGGEATGDSFEEASKKINHAVGLTRSIPCGANYNCVIEIDKPIRTIQKKKIQEPTPIIEKISEPIPEKKKVSKIKTEISESIKE